jgi:hypothetical protein
MTELAGPSMSGNEGSLRTRLLLEHWAKQWWTVWMGLVVVADLVVQITGVGHPLFRVATQAWVAAEVTIANTALYYQYLARPGAPLLPGVRRVHTVLAVSVFGLLVAPSVGVSLFTNPYPWAAVAALPVGVVLGLVVCPLQIVGSFWAFAIYALLLGFALIWLVVAPASTLDPIAAVVFTEPGALLLIGGIALSVVAALLYWTFGRPHAHDGAMSRWAVRTLPGDGWRDLEQFSESDFACNLRRRPRSFEPRTHLPSLREFVAAFRPLMPMSRPLLYAALLAVGFHAALWMVMGRDALLEPVTRGWHAWLALAGAQPSTAGAIRRVIRIEAMRPAPRRVILRAIGTAGLLNMSVFATALLALLIAGQALLAPETLGRAEFWQSYALIPVLLLVDAGAYAWMAARGSGQIAGAHIAVLIAAFFVTSLVTNTGWSTVWIAVVAGASIGLLLFRQAWSAWKGVEPGMSGATRSI